MSKVINSYISVQVADLPVQISINPCISRFRGIRRQSYKLIGDNKLTPFAPLEQPTEYRRALGRYPTGVTIITALEDGTPIGITANSFTSVSLAPPLILWSPAKASARHDAFVASDSFNIHVLASNQHDIALAFTRSKHSFDLCKVSKDTKAAPIITNCLVVFECLRHATHDAGDHTLVLGSVTKVRQNAGAPLTFYGGKFASP